MRSSWKHEIGELLYTLAPVAESINGTLCKKGRDYHDNDKKHFAKKLAKRRERNRNRKTHRN